MKLTRRELALAAITASAAQTQTPPPDLAKVVRDGQKRNSDTLTKFEIPIAIEPAFQFKA